MAYDEGLAERIREHVDGFEPAERKMFGGLSFLVAGNLACGVIKDELIVRVGPEHFGSALKKKHARAFDFTGRPMKGWVTVAPAGFEDDSDLASWVRMGLDFAATLPPK
ncbi:MAG: TfoX/Sxy family protein [Pseudomonadota bacterium]